MSSGDRVAPPVMASIGDTLRDMMRMAGSGTGAVTGSGEDEEGDGFRMALATCLGAHAGCGGKEQLAATMQVSDPGTPITLYLFLIPGSLSLSLSLYLSISL